MSDAPPPSGPSSQGQRRAYLLKPIASRHEAESRRMIFQAAEAVEPGRVIVLGGGACSEIPLAELAARFQLVTLNDIQRDAVEPALGRLPAEARNKVDVQIADLSGVTDVVLEKLRGAVHDAGDADDAIARMSQVVAEQPAVGMTIARQYELVIASCLLSQLNFWIVQGSRDVLSQRFAEEANRLDESRQWQTALEALSRRIEQRFMADLAKLVAERGRVYLSESVQMCFIELAPNGQWQTEGTWRMLESKDLRTYVPAQLTVIAEARWEWIVWPPQKPGDRGRLFEVQGLVLGYRSSS